MLRLSALLTLALAACSVGEVPLNGGGDDQPGVDGGGGMVDGGDTARCGPRMTPVAAKIHGPATNVPQDNPTAKGINCLNCHNGGTASKFEGAGTVYKPGNPKVDPQAGISVRLIPGNGNSPLVATTDDAGNFYFTGTIQFPATTDACFDDKQALMISPINGPADMNCNSAGCHQEPGGAQGGIKIAD